MSNLKTILEEYNIARAMINIHLKPECITSPNSDCEGCKKYKELDEKMLAKIEGMIPEKKKIPAQILGLDLTDEKDIKRFSQNQLDFGYNQAIEDFIANLGGENG